MVGASILHKNFQR